MIVAGLGCRRGCPAEALLDLLAEAGPVDILAAPAWKSAEPGLLEAARVFGRPLRFVDEAALAAVQLLCPTRSATAARTVGFASVAEAAALAGGGKLVRARFGNGWATCATALTHAESILRPLWERLGEGSPTILSWVSREQAGGPCARVTLPPAPLPQGEGESVA